MFFPRIETIKDILPKIEDKPEITISEHNGFTSIVYQISTETTFDSPIARECRGLVFGPDGKIVARPFHKFFNVNERQDTQEEAIEWDRIVGVSDKKDGSLVYFVPYKNCWIPKTKGSFLSTQAQEVMSLPEVASGLVENMLKIAGKDHTLLFEYVSPSNRVVVSYAKPELVLLAARHNVSGSYWTVRELEALANAACWPVEKRDFPIRIDPRSLIKKAKEHKGTDIEGWVLLRDDGEMYKIKTLDYMRAHKLKFNLSKTVILEGWASQTLDDTIASLNDLGLRDVSSSIADVKKELDSEYTNIVKYIEHMVELEGGVKTSREEIKAMALKYKDNEYFHLFMSKIKGLDVDYIKYVKNKKAMEWKNVTELTPANKIIDMDF